MALFVALAGTSYAQLAPLAAETRSGKIYACITEAYGTLNLAGPGPSCPKGQHLISWNEAGQRGKRGKPGKQGRPGQASAPGTVGPVGAAGQTGAPGPAGPAGPAGDTSGSVVSVDSGFGLTGGPITDTGALSVDPSVVQSRVSGTCPGDQAIQGVDQNGGVNCSSAFTPASRVLTSGVTFANNGQRSTLFQSNGFAVVLDCSDSVNARIRIEAQPATAGNVFGNSETLGFTVVGGLDGNAAPPANGLTIASTTANDRGDFNIGVSTGPLTGKTLDGSFSAFKFGGGCIGEASGIAS